MTGARPLARRVRLGLAEICAPAEQAESARTKTWFGRAKEELDVVDAGLAEHADALAVPAS